MIKFARLDLIAGVPASRIRETGKILHHLAQTLADGPVLVPCQRLRFDNGRTMVVNTYAPEGSTTPDVQLIDDGVQLTEV